MTKHYRQKQFREKGFISSYSLYSIIHESQGKNFEAEADAEATEKYNLLTCLAYLFIEPRSTSPGVVLPTVNWTLTYQSSIINQNKTTDLLTGDSGEDIVSIDVPSSKMTLNCDKLAKNYPSHCPIFFIAT